MQTCNPFKALSSRSEYQNIIPAWIEHDWQLMKLHSLLPHAAALCMAATPLTAGPGGCFAFPQSQMSWIKLELRRHFLNDLPNLPSCSPLNARKHWMIQNQTLIDFNRKYMGSQWYQYPALHFAYYSMAIRDFPKSQEPEWHWLQAKTRRSFMEYTTHRRRLPWCHANAVATKRM